ncbi:MAG: UDP-glucose/GDP-mannose dehydrogenase family protein [Negativicutes bacterium]
MRLVVVGTGYVGLVTGVCFADAGNHVLCVDKNKDRINKLLNGVMPIYEPGLEKMVAENVESGHLKFATSLSGSLDNADICFIAVGTPSSDDGSTDMSFVRAAAREIGDSIATDIIIVNKSTVPIGTADIVSEIITERLRLRKSISKFSVVSNPEFLKEGCAVADCMKPDRIIIGCDNPAIVEKLRQLYKPFSMNHDKFTVMSVRSAEMTKYAANAILATKISFINEMANICERIGADVNEVRIGIGSDSRIGYSFIYPGIGYGGSCFPKDVKSLIHQAQALGYTPSLLQSVKQVNDSQKIVLANRVIERFGKDLTGKHFAVWGLSFKPNTDDMREAPAIDIINILTARGATIAAYDPKSMSEAEQIYLKDNPNVRYCKNKYDALEKADALLLLTEWREFRAPDFLELGNRLNNKIIFDGRNQYIAYTDILENEKFEYHCIGKS